MPFTGKENHRISLGDAAVLTQSYRDSAGTDEVLAVFFGKEGISEILNQAGCVGIRIYNAKKNGKLTFVVVGVRSDEENMESGSIAEIGLPCPPFCPKSSSLQGSA